MTNIDNAVHVYSGSQWEGAFHTIGDAENYASDLRGIGANPKMYRHCEGCGYSHDVLVPCVQVRIPKDLQPLGAFYPSQSKRPTREQLGLRA